MLDLQKNAAIVLMALLLSFSVAHFSNLPLSVRHVASQENVPHPATGPPEWPDLALLIPVVVYSGYSYLEDFKRTDMKMSL